MKGTSERIQKVLKPFNIYLRNQSSHTLESQLIKLKDKIPIKEKTDVVYRIHCNMIATENILEKQAEI